MIRRPGNTRHEKVLSRKYNIIGLLIVVLPVLAFSFILYENKLFLNYSQYIILAMALVLILAGLAILRYIFDSMQMMVDFVEKADQGSDAISTAIGKDVSDLNKLSVLFTNLMERFEKSTDELNQRIVELNAIKEMTEVARETLHVDELLKLVLDKAMQAVGVKNGSVFLVDAADAEGLRFVAARPQREVDKSDSGQQDYSLIKSVVADGKPLIIQDIENDPRTQRVNDPKYGAPSFLSMPIYSHDGILAVLNLANKEKGGLFSESDERILSIMLGEIGFALENAVLHLKVKEHLSEIKEQNAKLEQEVQERLHAEENLRNVNEELQESNKNLTRAYEWMRNNRDQLKKHYFKEELGFLVDREGVIQNITERVLEMTKYSRAELIGRPFTDILDQSCQDDFMNDLRQSWLGITRNTRVVMDDQGEADRIFDATLTRFTSGDKREMLIILR